MAKIGSTGTIFVGLIGKSTGRNRLNMLVPHGSAQEGLEWCMLLWVVM